MITVSETQRPPDSKWVDGWERGLDPWHKDAMPPGFEDTGSGGERRKGWYAMDWCGNVVDFVPDGTIYTEAGEE